MGLHLVKQYSSVYEAFIAKSYLENNDIVAWLHDHHIVHLNWHYSLLVGDVKVMTLEEDAERAEKLLEEVEHNYREREENKCPRCSSSNTIRYRRYTLGQFPVFFVLFFITGIPMPYMFPPKKYGYLKCLDCKGSLTSLLRRCM